MKVFIEKENRTVEISGSFASAQKMLEELKISQNTVLIVRAGEVLLPQEPVNESDEIMLLSVVSGG